MITNLDLLALGADYDADTITIQAVISIQCLCYD